jgi:hypothetical protein
MPCERKLRAHGSFDRLYELDLIHFGLLACE